MLPFRDPIDETLSFRAPANGNLAAQAVNKFIAMAIHDFRCGDEEEHQAGRGVLRQIAKQDRLSLTNQSMHLERGEVGLASSGTSAASAAASRSTPGASVQSSDGWNGVGTQNTQAPLAVRRQNKPHGTSSATPDGSAANQGQKQTNHRRLTLPDDPAAAQQAVRGQPIRTPGGELPAPTLANGG